MVGGSRRSHVLHRRAHYSSHTPWGVGLGIGRQGGVTHSQGALPSVVAPLWRRCTRAAYPLEARMAPARRARRRRQRHHRIYPPWCHRMGRTVCRALALHNWSKREGTGTVWMHRGHNCHKSILAAQAATVPPGPPPQPPPPHRTHERTLRRPAAAPRPRPRTPRTSQFRKEMEKNRRLKRPLHTLFPVHKVSSTRKS